MAEAGTLPDALWGAIIKLLKPHHRANLRGACKRFRTLVNSEVRKVKLDPSNAEDALQWGLNVRFPGLEHIEIIKPSEVDCFTDQTFAQLALKDLARLPTLTSCNLENCTQLTVAGMAALALACSGIKKLVIPQVCQLCMSDSMLLVLAKLPELNKLRVQCCKHCDEVALAYLSDLKRLTALELEDYGQALRQVTQLTSLTSLRSVMVWSDFTLDVSDNGLGLGLGVGHGPGGAAPGQGGHGAAGAHGGPAGAGMLGGGGHGQFGGLLEGGGAPPGPQPLNPMMAAAAAAAAAVANMQLNGDGAAAGDHALAEVDGGGGDGGDGALNAMFAHQLQLTEQVLSNIFAGKAALLEWVTGMTALTHVDIQRVDINSAELEQFAALPGLLHLGVGDLNMQQEPARQLPSVTKLVSHNILNEAHLRPTFPALRALSCDAADRGLAHIAELTGLMNLFLWTSPSDSITDAGLASLASLSGLETFRLEGSDTVSDAGWVRFAEAHRRLTRVDLVKCPNVTDIGFILSIRQLTRLQRISFVDCPGIDTRTLAALLAFCPDLEHIELQDCTAITLASLRALLASVSRLDLDVVYRKGGASRTLHGT